MSIKDARPGDIYVDEFGKVWRVMSYCSEPTVGMERLELADDIRNSPVTLPHKKHAAVNAELWSGFKLLHVAKPPKARTYAGEDPS